MLIAPIVTDHVHHAAAGAWLGGIPTSFATCPITEGSLLRLLLRDGQPTATAAEVLEALSLGPRHEFWPDDISYRVVPVKAS